MKKLIIVVCPIFIFACQSLRTKTINIPISSSEITYRNTIRPILTNYCTTCHSGNNPASGLNLTTYQNVKYEIENGDLLSRINDKSNPMPQGNLISRNMRQAIEQWAKNGFKYETNFDKNETSVGIKDKDSVLLSTIVPIDIDKQGFDFFDLMQGHWVGNMMILGQKYDWFSFDYRPISPSQIHGIYEGGTIGNIYTSFFVASFNGKKTIMARNGGILNDIYRTSYFVLDKVELSKARKYFRFVDAYGGKNIMFMELEFTENKLNFKSYTSRFGLIGTPKLHMNFQGKKKSAKISNYVAKLLKFPKNEIEIDFSDGLPMPNWGEEYSEISSSSYIYQGNGEDLLTLAKLSGDPYTIEDIPYLSKLKVEIEQNEKIIDKKLIIYLSKESLTTNSGKIVLEHGYIKKNLFDGVLSFPIISPNQKEFIFTYLHPGNYYLTIVADSNNDEFISKGDITSKSVLISVKPNSEQVIQVNNITEEN